MAKWKLGATEDDDARLGRDTTPGMESRDIMFRLLDWWNNKGGLKYLWDTYTGEKQNKETNASNEKATAETNQANKDIAHETNEYNLQQTQETNELNQSVAMSNLQFQKEQQAYEEALQQKIFDREDTAYQRTVSDMQKAGLNPLTMNGTDNSGQQVARTPLNNSMQYIKPDSAVTPTMQAPHYQGNLTGFRDGINSLISLGLKSYETSSEVSLNNAKEVIENGDREDRKKANAEVLRGMEIANDKAKKDLDYLEEVGQSGIEVAHNNEMEVQRYNKEAEKDMLDSEISAQYQRVLAEIESKQSIANVEAELKKQGLDNELQKLEEAKREFDEKLDFEEKQEANKWAIEMLRIQSNEEISEAERKAREQNLMAELEQNEKIANKNIIVRWVQTLGSAIGIVAGVTVPGIKSKLKKGIQSVGGGSIGF